MPSSPEDDLEALKTEIQTKIESEGGTFNSFEEEPIAFGLKAIILTMALPETIDSDIIGNKINEIEKISSAELIDYRRAVG